MGRRDRVSSLSSLDSTVINSQWVKGGEVSMTADPFTDHLRMPGYWVKFHVLDESQDFKFSYQEKILKN